MTRPYCARTNVNNESNTTRKPVKCVTIISKKLDMRITGTTEIHKKNVRENCNALRYKLINDTCAITEKALVEVQD